jgi:hypothetical protein
MGVPAITQAIWNIWYSFQRHSFTHIYIHKCQNINLNMLQALAVMLSELSDMEATHAKLQRITSKQSAWVSIRREACKYANMMLNTLSMDSIHPM